MAVLRTKLPGCRAVPRFDSTLSFKNQTPPAFNRARQTPNRIRWVRSQQTRFPSSFSVDCWSALALDLKTAIFDNSDSFDDCGAIFGAVYCAFLVQGLFRDLPLAGYV